MILGAIALISAIAATCGIETEPDAWSDDYPVEAREVAQPVEQGARGVVSGESADGTARGAARRTLDGMVEAPASN